MNDTAKRIAANLLEIASESFSNHGCNDYVLDNTPENYEFVKAANINDGLLGEDAEPNVSQDGTKIYAQDFALMSYCSHLLTKSGAK